MSLLWFSIFLIIHKQENSISPFSGFESRDLYVITHKISPVGKWPLVVDKIYWSKEVEPLVPKGKLSIMVMNMLT